VESPAWLFGPVWTTLYVFMGIVLTRLLLMRSALKDPHSKAWTAMSPSMAARVRGLAMTQASVHASHALVMFGIQWVFNALWSPIFFGMKSPMLGLVDIALLWLTLRRMIPVLWRVDRFSAWLFIPYFAWVSFATALNAAIVQLN
jgi:tryptophan-rich sensory protein